MTQPAQQVDEVLSVLAERFGTTAGHLWEVLVLQSYIEGILWMVAFVVYVAAVVTYFKVPVKRYHDDEVWKYITTFGGIIVIAATIFIPVMAFIAIAMIVNPEYYALQKILAVIGGGS